MNLKSALTFSFILLTIQLHVFATSPAVINGKLDLRDYHGPLDKISLAGEWQFYWNQLLQPEEINEWENDGIIATVPSYWTEYKNEIPGISGKGYATYKLLVLLPGEMNKKLALDIPIFDSSYELFLNGKSVAHNGKVGRDKNSSRPDYVPKLYAFTNSSDSLEIVIHVSNFYHRRGGFWLDMKLGNEEKLRTLTERWKIIDSAVIGILFISIILFGFLYYFFKWNRAFLFFALATLGILFRLMNTGYYPGLAFFEQDWTWTVRMEYLGTIFAVAFGAFYMNALFPSKTVKKISNINAIIMAIIALTVLVLKPAQFSYTVYIIQFSGILMLGYYFVRSIQGLRKRKVMESVFFFSVIIFLLAAVNDILVSNSSSPFNSDYYVPLAFLVFVELQILIVLREWIRTYQEKLSMHSELENINRNLEGIIESRTKDLENSNEELREALDLKNRIFSIIAHDLKSPIATISQQAELLKNKNPHGEDSEFIKELHRLSFAAVHLIDNLLFWGRKQENKIQYNPTFVSPGLLLDEVLLLLQSSIDKKGIALNKQADNSITAYADPTLLQIILQNLVSNAVKFTYENGEILISVETGDEGIKVRIQDDGVGMKEELIQQVFDNSIASSYGTSGEKGTGLGLLLVHELVEINKGSLHIQSKPGKGTAVMFTLPGKP